MAVAEGPAIEMQQVTNEMGFRGAPAMHRRDDDEDDNCCAECCCRTMGCVACFITCPFVVCCSCKVIQQYEQGILFRLGRVVRDKLLNPGMTWINPYIDSLVKVDTRALIARLVRQEVLTKDGVTLFVDGVITYKVVDPLKSVKTIVNVEYAVQMLGRSALRNILSKHTLSEFQAQRKEVVLQLVNELRSAAQSWGIEMAMTLSDIQLPADLHKSMAIEANAVRNANANVISAEAELRSARSLKQAADIMNEAPMTAKLRYLQTLGEISGPRTNVIAYALPIEVLQYAASYPDPAYDRPPAYANDIEVNRDSPSSSGLLLKHQTEEDTSQNTLL